MGIQDTVRRQEEKLAAQSKPQTQPKQPAAQAQPVLDLQALRQVIQEVIHAELQRVQAEQPTQRDPQQPLDMQALQTAVRASVRAELHTFQAEQPTQRDAQAIDMQAFQHVIQSAIRAELQGVQTTLTILTNAIQAQTDAFNGDTDDVEQEQDDLLPTASPHHTDANEEDTEDEKVYPSEEDEDEDAVREEEDDLTKSLPRPPEPPTHKLRRTGPGMIVLGGVHPVTGVRRWESIYEQ